MALLGRNSRGFGYAGQRTMATQDYKTTRLLLRKTTSQQDYETTSGAVAGGASQGLSLTTRQRVNETTSGR